MKEMQCSAPFVQMLFFRFSELLSVSKITGPILESKGMHVIFQKKGKKGQKNVKKGKKGKIFQNLGKNVQNIFEKGQVIACGHCT